MLVVTPYLSKKSSAFASTVTSSFCRHGHADRETDRHTTSQQTHVHRHTDTQTHRHTCLSITSSMVSTAGINSDTLSSRTAMFRNQPLPRNAAMAFPLCRRSSLDSVPTADSSGGTVDPLPAARLANKPRPACALTEQLHRLPGKVLMGRKWTNDEKKTGEEKTGATEGVPGLTPRRQPVFPSATAQRPLCPREGACRLVSRWIKRLKTQGPDERWL
jgi:hypothetical protein